MITTFHFTDLPKRLIYATEGYTMSKWTRGVEKDILAEIGHLPKTTWILEENDLVILHIDLKEEATDSESFPEIENVRCLLHNMYQGKIIKD